MSCDRSSFAKCLDLVEDGRCRDGPHKGLRFAMVLKVPISSGMPQVVMDGPLQLAHVGEGAPPDAPPRDLGAESPGLVGVVARVLGEPQNARNKRSRTRLRTVAELYPEVVDPALDVDNELSCSAIEALDRQEAFVNAVLAHHALALLARLFRYGQVSYHGGFVDVATSRSVPLAVEPSLLSSGMR